jgi:transposase
VYTALPEGLDSRKSSPERRRDLFTEVDLVFFDTTSLYFEGRGGESIGKRGHSKDHRPDLYQMVVGMALDVEGRFAAETRAG